MTDSRSAELVLVEEFGGCLLHLIILLSIQMIQINLLSSGAPRGNMISQISLQPRRLSPSSHINFSLSRTQSILIPQLAVDSCDVFIRDLMMKCFCCYLGFNCSSWPGRTQNINKDLKQLFLSITHRGRNKIKRISLVPT